MIEEFRSYDFFFFLHKMEGLGALEVLDTELLWVIFHFVGPKSLLSSATVRES